MAGATSETATSTMGQNKWAILIGIESYDPPGQLATTPRKNQQGETIRFKSLEGCVNDILDVEDYLMQTIGVPQANIKKLLSPLPGHPRLVNRTDYERPTYQNMVNALKNVGKNPIEIQIPESGIESKQQQQFVYVHFSGHGAITSTIFPVAKRQVNTDDDEVLVPCDITTGGQYLRDLELAALLEDMVARGCVVTIVLDCCHSGGAIRGEEDDETKTGLTRAVDGRYISDPKVDKCLEQARIDFWVEKIPSWIVAPRGFVALTACMSTEKAKETRASPRHGVLTDCLLRCLRGAPGSAVADVPAQALFEGIRSAVRSVNKFQTPDLIGDRERFFFSSRLRRKTYALRVGSSGRLLDARIPVSLRKLVLEGGAMHGVEAGHGYDILPRGFDLGRPVKREDPVARVVVESADDYHAIAKFKFYKDKQFNPRWDQIVEGCPAVLNKVPIEKKRAVRFVPPNDNLLAQFHKAWRESRRVPIQLRLVDPGDLGAALDISVNSLGNLTISDANGALPPAMQQMLVQLPALDMAQSVPQLIARLEHLARYETTRSLGAVGTLGVRAGSLATSVSCKIACLDPVIRTVNIGGVPTPRASEDEVVYDSNEGYWRIPEEKAALMVLRSVFPSDSTSLSVVVLAWSAELGVSQLWPHKGHTHDDFLPEKPEIEFVIAPGVAPEMRAVAEAGGKLIEMYKVFVSEATVPVSALIMDSLSEQEEFNNTRGAAEGTRQWDDLDDLLGELDVDRSTRSTGLTATPATWAVVDVKVRVIPRVVAQDELDGIDGCVEVEDDPPF